MYCVLNVTEIIREDPLPIRPLQTNEVAMRIFGFLFFAFALCISTQITCAQGGRVIVGVVVDSTTRTPLSAASVFIRDTKRGTFTNRNGEFRLPIDASHKQLTVRSIGYKERTLSIPDTDTVRIVLAPSNISTTPVVVTADMTAEELIRRAVLRKEENAARIKTMISTLYSKSRFDRERIAIEKGENVLNTITETFSKVYERRTEPRLEEVVILQRRQTKDVAADKNLTVLDDFFDITQDEITIIKTQLITPLGRDALDEYKYRITGKKMLGDKLIYELEFEPKARIFPGFEGKLSIVEGTYQLIAADFGPTSETAIPFIRGIRFEQRYERYDDSVWALAYQYATGSAKVSLIIGLAELDFRVAVQTYATDIQVNVPLPDSIGKPRPVTKTPSMTSMSSQNLEVDVEIGGTRVTVAPDADSAKSEFWDAHAFSTPSEEEQAIYKRADSIAPKRDTTGKVIGGPPQVGVIPLPSIGPVGLGLTPVFDRTTITGVMYGGMLTAATSYATLNVLGAFGQKDTRIGSVMLNVNVLQEASYQLSATASVFSNMSTLSMNSPLTNRFEAVDFGGLLFAQSRDFYRTDGYDIGARLSFSRFNVGVMYTDSRHINMPVIGEVDHTPVGARAGAYQSVHGLIGIGQPSIFDQLIGGGWPLFGTIAGTLVFEHSSGTTYPMGEVYVGTVIPTFPTGYQPMELSIDVKAGMAHDSLPRQYQFAALRRYMVFGSAKNLATIPVGAYGGTEFVSIHAEHNFSDMWWRGIGLPAYHGRGIDLLALASTLNMVQRGRPEVPGSIYDSTNGWYTEVGFGLSRIPTFVSDLLFLRFDALWPVGRIAQQRGTFGWSITLSSFLL